MWPIVPIKVCLSRIGLREMKVGKPAASHQLASTRKEQTIILTFGDCRLTIRTNPRSVSTKSSGSQVLRKVTRPLPWPAAAARDLYGEAEFPNPPNIILPRPSLSCQPRTIMAPPTAMLSRGSSETPTSTRAKLSCLPWWIMPQLTMLLCFNAQ